MRYDTIVIGCGPAGMEVTRLLARAGQKVACIEKGQWGGTCLNAGCVPTKMLLAATAPGENARYLRKYKEVSGKLLVDYPALQKRIWRYVGGTSMSIVSSLTSFGAILMKGQARFLDKSTISLTLVNRERRELQADRFIIATGSRPAELSGLPIDHTTILNSTDILRLEAIPDSLCVIGTGAIGLELASFFHSLGSRIILLEAASQIAPTEDADISALLHKILATQGYEIHTQARIGSLEKIDDKAVITLDDDTRVETDKVLVAVGRAGNAGELDCSVAGCGIDQNSFVPVNEYLQATENIYAIGDANGKTLLAHAATHQARWTAKFITGKTDASYTSGTIPFCVHGSMEIMRAGLTEYEALRLHGADVGVSYSQFAINTMAQANAETEGFVKAIFVNGQLMGMAAIGVHASELVTAAQLLVTGDYTPDKLDSIMIAHPSLSEALENAIRNPARKISA